MTKYWDTDFHTRPPRLAVLHGGLAWRAWDRHGFNVYSPPRSRRTPRKAKTINRLASPDKTKLILDPQITPVKSTSFLFCEEFNGTSTDRRGFNVYSPPRSRRTLIPADFFSRRRIQTLAYSAQSFLLLPSFPVSEPACLNKK